MSESKIVAAVGVSANALGPGGKERAKIVEAAMQQAIVDACAEGLRVNEDATEIRARMMAARAKALAELNAPPAASSAKG